MRLYQIGVYEKSIPEDYPFMELLKYGKESGYDFFEISIDKTEKRINRLYDKLFHDELRSAMKQTGFHVESMCLSALGTYTLGSEDSSIEERSLDIFKHAIDFASEFGLRIVQIPACDIPKGGKHTIETNERFIKNLSQMIAYASAKSVMIGLENMEDQYMDNVEKSLKLIRIIDSPFFQLYSDSGNITSAAKLYKKNPIEDFNLGHRHHIAFHLKETRPNKYGGLFYGEGHVDFQSLVSSAWMQGVRRFVLEFWYTGNQAWKDDLIKAREMCENWIQKAIRGDTCYERI